MRFSWLALTLLVSAPLAQAQFKWVDDQGRIGYGDKPPADAHDIEALNGVTKGRRPDPLEVLPYELQRTVKEFPVTLYAMTECPACDKARSMLKARSIPFAERAIRTSEDVRALKKLTGSDQLPVFQVGARTITGFNSAVWDEMLDLAGYPRKNLLPADWAWPAPRPLTEETAAPAPAAQNAAAPAPGNPQ
jgi:glutaredoxin